MHFVLQVQYRYQSANNHNNIMNLEKKVVISFYLFANELFNSEEIE